MCIQITSRFNLVCVARMSSSLHGICNCPCRVSLKFETKRNEMKPTKTKPNEIKTKRNITNETDCIIKLFDYNNNKMMIWTSIPDPCESCHRGMKSPPPSFNVVFRVDWNILSGISFSTDYCLKKLVIYNLFHFVLFLISFRFFRYVSFVCVFCFVSVGFVPFQFRFAFYRYPFLSAMSLMNVLFSVKSKYDSPLLCPCTLRYPWRNVYSCELFTSTRQALKVRQIC